MTDYLWKNVVAAIPGDWKRNVQWNLPEKQSFKIYFSCFTSEDFSSSIIQFDKTLMSTLEFLATSKPYID